MSLLPKPAPVLWTVPFAPTDERSRMLPVLSRAVLLMLCPSAPVSQAANDFGHLFPQAVKIFAPLRLISLHRFQNRWRLMSDIKVESLSFFQGVGGFLPMSLNITKITKVRGIIGPSETSSPTKLLKGHVEIQHLRMERRRQSKKNKRNASGL